MDMKIIQTAWVVDDIKTAIRKWSALTGIGPFYVMPRVGVESALQNSNVIDLNISAALAYSGDMQIELIQQKGGVDTCFKVSKNPHHMAIYSHNFDEDTKEINKDFNLSLSCVGVSGTRFSYFDMRSLNGCYLELLEFSEPMDNLYLKIKETPKEKNNEVIYTVDERGINKTNINDFSF